MNAPSPVKNGLLLLASVLFACGLGETCLRFNPPAWLPAQSYDSIQQHTSEPSSDPEIGYVPSPGTEKILNGREFSTRVKISSGRMRDREYPQEKNAGVRRIAAVGDSYVFGWGVESSETLTEIMEDRQLKNAEVLNMGVSGYCGSQAAAWLESQAAKYWPDVVLFFTCGFPVECSPDYGFVNGKMVWKSEVEGGSLRWLKARAYRSSYLFGLLHFVYGRFREITASAWRRWRGEAPQAAEDAAAHAENLRQGGRVLERLARASEKYGFKTVLVYYHERPEVEEGTTPLEAENIRLLRETSARNGWGFVDLAGAMRRDWLESRESAYFVYDVHWNRRGHEIAAGTLTEYLAAQNLAEAR